jgi:hypothetical protein
VLGQPQVIVGAQVEHRFAIGYANRGALRRHDDAFTLVGAGRADGAELGFEVWFEGAEHGD